MFGRHRRGEPSTQDVYAAKNELAKPGRFYGIGGTIHGSGALDVEIHDGHVVAVWFRCQVLPFREIHVNRARANDRLRALAFSPTLTGVEVRDH